MDPGCSSPVAERILARHLAGALGWPFVDMTGYEISCGILSRIPAELACRLRSVPMVFNERRVVLVVDDPFAACYLAANQQLLGPPYRFRLEFAMTSRSGMDRCLERRLALVR